ncbi:MAG: tRNA-binding protein [Brumimicrobium sp.]
MLEDNLDWEEFERVDMRVGTIIKAENFEAVKKPALKLWVDVGGEIGILKTSAQITEKYNAKSILDKQVVVVVNFPPKQIANMMSECLLLGALEADGVVIIQPEQKVKNGTRIM